MIVGDPSLVCTSQSNFYYAATWWDGENVLTGVALAASTNGGKSYAQPVVAISKNGFTHEIVKDSLAIDPANTSQMYITYVDDDYSGTTCGEFPVWTRMPDIQSRGTQLSLCRHRTAGRIGMRQW